MGQYVPTLKVRGGNRWMGVLDAIAEGLSKRKELDVGFMDGASYPDGTQVAEVAAIQEYGSTTIPARPYFREMIDAKEAEWGPAIADLLKANNYNAQIALNIAGEAIAGQLKQSIVDFVGTPLAESTIKRKGHEKQLIDTSVMLNSVSHKVR